MTTENIEPTPEQIQQEQMRLAQVQQVRDALVQNIFAKYYEFIKCLNLLPIDQRHAGMQRAYGHIDDGMLWVKEILNTAPLVFAPPPATPAPVEEKVESTEIKTEEAAPQDETPPTPEQAA